MLPLHQGGPRRSRGAPSILPERRACGHGCDGLWKTGTVPLTVVVSTALALATAAGALTGWMRRVAGTESRWLGSRLHLLLAAAGGAGAAAVAASWIELVTFALVALACALLVVVDLATYRLPDAITGPTCLVLLVGLAAAAAAGGAWADLGRAALAGVVLLLLYFLLAFVNPAGLGLGDVKLAGILGGLLGWFGWTTVFLGAAAGFLLSGLVGLVILATRRGGLKSEFPFGPWMVAGAALGIALGNAA